MNRDTNELQRSPGEFILFAIIFLGFVLGAAGVVVSSVPAWLSGFFLMFLGLCYFMLKSS
jgi:hypothetical protein